MNHTIKNPPPAHRTQVTWFIDPQFTQDQKLDIISGINDWAQDTRYYLEVRYASIREESNYRVLVDIPDPLDPEDKILAFANAIPGNIVRIYTIRMNGYSYRYLMHHELGHIFGASHIANTTMNPTFNDSNFECIDRLTMQQVATQNRWDIDNLEYCL